MSDAAQAITAAFSGLVMVVVVVGLFFGDAIHDWVIRKRK